MTSRLSQICCYPVKSAKGHSLDQGYISAEGLHFDRRFMVAKANGDMVTARTHPQLVLINVAFDGYLLKLGYPNHGDIKYTLQSKPMTPHPATVWGDNFSAYHVSESIDQWLSVIANEPVKLLYCGEQSNRHGAEINQSLSMADGYPLLLISQGSLDELNRRSPDTHSMDQFRPNLVVDCSEPFIEDSWDIIEIGSVRFKVAKPCSRCNFTTVNPNTGRYHPQQQPLITLSEFRADERGEVMFGQNLIALNEGEIKRGDALKVISHKTAPVYHDDATSTNRTPSQQITAQKKQAQRTELDITINGQRFRGNNHSSILEQAIAAGIKVPFKCRAGKCGTCAMTLISGEVDSSAMATATTTDDQILSCSCTALSNVELALEPPVMNKNNRKTS
ncbi:YcbX family protein [Paraferrimonas haliotis]|uniref:(2Fe-2S)-binding protein n=1 Tax=Paraferrimonas haliotis TaxID=2013866 RepID=A0AA37TY69_9GAMM|nr:YcbX family protein [Paraferrimonas haliotis]GLS84475.1 (2Fe-2S)-binding protein [Paraferrimonas haliotis]